MGKQKQYIAYADGMRVIAILAVIILHASASGVIQYGQIDPEHWWASNIIDSMCRWAMPLFIMLSGCLNLSQEREESVATFLGRRFRRVGIPLVVWGVINFIWQALFEGREVTFDYVVSSVARGLIINHLYFLFVLIMLYAITPVLDILISKFSKKFVFIVSLVIFILASTGFLFRYIPMNALTMFIPYIPYYLSGFIIRSYMLKKPHFLISIVLYLLISTIISIKTGELVSQYGIDDYRALSYYEYFHVAVIIQTFCAYVIIIQMMSQMKNKNTLKFFRYLGNLSFGVYLSHFMFLGLAIALIRPLFKEYSAWEILIEAPLVYFASVLLISALINIPFIRGIVGEAGKAMWQRSPNREI